jgi:hypothetical protein
VGGHRRYAAMVGISPIGNMPLNAATLRAMTNLDPQLWTSTRRRWDRFHTARNLLNRAGVALVAVAAARS